MLKSKSLLFIVFSLTLFIQCSKENKFSIEKGRVGALTNESSIGDLNIVFENDSIVSHLNNKDSDTDKNMFTSGNDE